MGYDAPSAVADHEKRRWPEVLDGVKKNREVRDLVGVVIVMCTGS